MTALDVIGPYQVLAGLPDVDVVFVAAHDGEVRDDVGALAFPIGATYAAVDAPDMIVVPGGSTAYRKSIDVTDPTVAWIRSVHPHTRYTTSVCTGSLLPSEPPACCNTSTPPATGPPRTSSPCSERQQRRNAGAL